MIVFLLSNFGRRCDDIFNGIILRKSFQVLVKNQRNRTKLNNLFTLSNGKTTTIGHGADKCASVHSENSTQRNAARTDMSCKLLDLFFQ